MHDHAPLATVRTPPGLCDLQLLMMSDHCHCRHDHFRYMPFAFWRLPPVVTAVLTQTQANSAQMSSPYKTSEGQERDIQHPTWASQHPDNRAIRVLELGRVMPRIERIRRGRYICMRRSMEKRTSVAHG